jgi:hypothetical protein
MRKVTFALLAALVLALGVVAVASAQLGGYSYDSGFQVANLSSSNTANIVVEFVAPDGTVDDSLSDSIAPNDSATYNAATLPAGWSGSVVISSDQEVAAIANLLADTSSGTRVGGADYNGMGSGSSEVFVPQIFNDFFGIYTWFNVQNTSGSAISVTVNYNTNNGTCSEGPVTVQPKAATTFDQSTTSASCVSPSDTIGAATVTVSGGEAVATVVQYNASSLLAYNGFSSTGSTEVVFPLVSHRFFNSRTGIQVQNTGASSTNVTISYTPSAGFPGSACSETKTVPAGASVVFGDNAFFQQPSLPCGPMTGSSQSNFGFVGSAAVTANTNSQTLVAIVNSVTAGTPNAATYNAFDPNGGTSKVSFPQIMDRFFGIFTGISVANVGTGNTNITCTFSGSAVTVTANNVAPGAALTHTQQAQIANGYLGSATCTSSAEPIVGVVSQIGGVAGSDLLLYYEGANFGP